MLTFNQYVRAGSLEEAYNLYQKKNNVVIGGMLWLKMQRGKKGTVIDLCDLGLNRIEEDEESFRIGAMVSLRALELHPGLQAETCGAAADSVRHIVGVQFRNTATVGGSIYGRFGFSDVLTLFLALDAQVELYKAGVMRLEDFVRMPRKTRDILVSVIVPKRSSRRLCYQSMRLTQTDFPVLTCCAAAEPGKTFAVVGARPQPAVCIYDEQGILTDGIDEDSAAGFAAYAASRTKFGSNMRGTAEYREHLCRVLVRRCVLETAKEERTWISR